MGIFHHWRHPDCIRVGGDEHRAPLGHRRAQDGVQQLTERILLWFFRQAGVHEKHDILKTHYLRNVDMDGALFRTHSAEYTTQSIGRDKTCKPELLRQRTVVSPYR